MEQINGFPSDFLSVKEKNSEEYALKYCRSAWSNQNSGNVWNGYLNRERIEENRNTALGIIDVDKFKSRLGAMGNVAYNNLNYDVQSPLPNYINSIVGAIINQPIRLDVQTGVLTSTTEYDKEYQKRLSFYKLYQQADAIKEQTGVDIKNKIPEKYWVANEEEVELQMMDWREATCVALEDSLNFIERKNDVEVNNEFVVRDLVENTIGATRLAYDINGDIIRRRVDIKNFVCSWSDGADFKRIKYAGEVEYLEASELMEVSGFSEETLKELIKTFSSSSTSGINRITNFGAGNLANMLNNGQWRNQKIAVLNLQWITSNKVEREVFKTDKGARRMKYAKPNGSKKANHIDFIKKYEQDVYEATWVIGSDKIYNHGRKTNQLLEKSNGFNKQLDYTIYMYNINGMKSMSVVDRLKTVSEHYQTAILKAQALIARLRPPQIVFDISSINATLAGMGKVAQTPRDIQDIAESTGVIYTSMRTQNGKATQSKPVYEVQSQSTQQIGTLIDFAMSKMQEMQSIIGVPLSTIGAMDKDALVGIEKMKAINRNNSLVYLNNAYKNIIQRTAEKEAQMIVDSIRNGAKLEDFEIAIGKLNTSAIDLKKEILLKEHNIYIKALPDVIELENITNYVNQSLQAGIIKASDALYAEEIAKQNPDKVRSYLKVKEEKYARMQQEQAAAASRAQAEAQAQAQAMIEQAKAQTEQLKSQMEMMRMEKEGEIKARQSQIDFMEDSKLLHQKLLGELEKIRVATAEAAKANQLSEGNDMKNTSLPAATGVKQPSTPRGVGN